MGSRIDRAGDSQTAACGRFLMSTLLPVTHAVDETNGDGIMEKNKNGEKRKVKGGGEEKRGGMS